MNMFKGSYGVYPLDTQHVRVFIDFPVKRSDDQAMEELMRLIAHLTNYMRQINKGEGE